MKTSRSKRTKAARTQKRGSARTPKRSTKPRQRSRSSARKLEAAPEAKAVALGSAEGAPSAFISIDDQDVILLETNNYIGMSGLENIVFRAFAANASSRRAGTAWLAFGTCGRPHHAGKDSWIGLSRSVPLPIINGVQAEMVASGLEVEREMGRALHLKMNPLARLSDDGLEILVPAALVGDPSNKRVVPRGGTNPVARGYQVRPSRAAALNELFFGKGDSSDGLAE